MVQLMTNKEQMEAPQNVSSRTRALELDLAKELSNCSPRKSFFPIPARLKKLKLFFQLAYNHFEDATKTQVTVSSTSEWLLDNFYVLEQALREVEDDLPTDYYSRLAKTADGWPRIHIVALAITRREFSRFDIDQLRFFIQEFQSVTPLSIGELWAFPLMLRLTVLETLADGLAGVTKLDWDSAPQPQVWTKLQSASNSPEPDPETMVINSIQNLRLIATLDWKTFFESTSVLEKILQSDPAQAYAQSEFETRNHYRSVIEELALGSPMSEVEIASCTIQLAENGSTERERHIGYFLIGAGKPTLEKNIRYRPNLRGYLLRAVRRHPTFAYLGSIAFLAILIYSSAVYYAISSGGNLAQVIAITLLALAPASAVAVDLINWLTVSTVPPRILPKLDFEAGIPVEDRTMVVIPALFSTERDVTFLTNQMESHFVANGDPNIFFALLTDFADAPEKEMPLDVDLITQAQDRIRELNAKYSNGNYHPFFLFHRERTWNPSEECWMGWERKRGKLEEFNKLLRESTTTTYNIQFGDLGILPSIRYVITLDADTLLPRDSARRLIGTLAHPLNRAEFESNSDEIKAGYSILQPRAQVRPAVVNQSLFTRAYAGDSAIDLYTRAVSDVYQDLFGEGSYVGKGIYDVDAFQRSLHDKVPENHLLSHDLFEAVQGSCGLVTDVVLFEDYPPHYLAYTDRLHRWVRGDWQLLPWLGKWVPHRVKGRTPSTLSIIDQWKLLDNLRRSLMAPISLVLLITGWLFLPGEKYAWTLLALVPFLMPILTNFISDLRRVAQGKTSNVVTRPIQLATLRSLFEIIFLPHESMIYLDAIATTLTRLYVTHRSFLQWMTAAHTVQLFGKRLRVKSAWQAMVVAPLIALATGIAILVRAPEALIVATPLLIGWIISPFVAARISKPDLQPEVKLTPAQEKKLRLLSRSTWLYFEHFVGPEDRWLPPDHFQENPRGLVQHQTSPTNIGLMLLSTLSAHDMGYIGATELSLRLRDTFDSMDSLERIRGHFLNWYDTRTFAPLPPRYVSTVDSGNLAACLLTLKQGCVAIGSAPIVQWQGLVDTIDMLLHTVDESNIGKSAQGLKRVIFSIREQAEVLCNPDRFSSILLETLLDESQAEFENLLWEAIQNSGEDLPTESLRNLSNWVQRVRYHLRHIRTEIQILAPWLMTLAEAPSLVSKTSGNVEVVRLWNELLATLSLHPTLGDIPNISEHATQLLQDILELLDAGDSAAFEWCEVLTYDLQAAHKFSSSLLDDFSTLAKRAEIFFDEMNFNFLYSTNRRVFHIGYNAESGRLDSNYYDLMASESRIASLIAIARGDVPQNHWLYLARPLTELDGKRALLSWSGTMFEYLMPVLLVKSYPNTLMDQSCRVAVEQQIEYAAENEIPWGISESSYYNFDSAQIYQYQAFGVPHLGYKRGLSDHLVVTPYASVLALPFAPLEVMQNVAWFEKHKMWGAYGLYESIDFTPERLRIGEDYAIVRSYMAHHQGMILLSLHNKLLNNRMVQRLHSDPRMKSVELLLQEQTPINAPTEHPRPQQMETAHYSYVNVPMDPWRVSADAPYHQLHCLSNGRYSLLITASGSGFSRRGDIELTRWRPDSTLDDWGQWIYVEDRISGDLWSATPQPTMKKPDRNEVSFLPHRVDFERQDEDIVLRTSITIAPEDDVEIRRLTLINNGKQQRVFALTSYSEIILAQQSVDERHPAFNKLFIESEYLSEEHCLLFHRRPRSSSEKPVYVAHFFTNHHADVTMTGYETDRKLFVGRGGTDRHPVVFSGNESSVLSGTTGATLDPICALQAEISIAPYETAQIAFVTLVADSRREALQMVYLYRRWSQIARAMSDARIHAEKEITQLEITSSDIEKFQKLLSPLLYPSPVLRADAAILASNALGQPGLWTFGISGDYPILLVRLKNEENITLLGDVLLAYSYWRRRGVMIDVVIVNQLESGYDQDLHGKIMRAIGRTGNNTQINKRGGVFILHEDQMNESERILLATAARVILDGEAGSLESQLSGLDVTPLRLPSFVPIEQPSSIVDETPNVQRPTDLLFDNELGGFTADGREYVIYLEPDQWTPAPWVNVMATSELGCIVSETGLGCTWGQNSGENRITPWRNDQVSDPPAEAIYLRDEDTGEIWSPTPLPARANAPYLIRHGAGYSIFEHASHGLEQTVRVFVAANEPVKIVQLKLHNNTDRLRRVNTSYFAEWVLGTTHESTAPYIVPEFASKNFALLARNTYNQDFCQRIAFLASTREPNGVTADRSEFLGAHGSYARPAALERVGFTPRVEAGIDPCAALQMLLWLQPGETKEVTFLLGQGRDRDDTERLISHFQNIQNIELAWTELNEFWDEILAPVQVETPDKAMDILLNRWLLYQSLSSRFWGRTGFYQSSGAYGYRDQLQDSMAYVHVKPGIVRNHLLEAASYQFEAGDVLHWWHPPAGRGLRTRCSDDLLWLPYVTAYYVQTTGDESILKENVPFLSADPLKPDEHERYGQFPSATEGTLYEHCIRAIAKGTTSGTHGIPLMGAHDWNDGMNLVGVKGQGESIWLGWFLASTLTNFASICDLMNDVSKADDYRKKAKTICDAIESAGWDGKWYRRAYYDDGTPLGSIENNECKIDSIAQSWAVISKGGDKSRAKQAMDSLYERLVRKGDELVLLLTPPFDKTPRNPGYIKGYAPGIRENGGQYTHAALWAIWAFAELGQGDRAHELFQLINPVHHADTLEKANRYRVEPYVIAADVYSTTPHTGRGGWTWYTGSASWMYRLGIERLLGLNRVADKLEIKPTIPAEWKGFQVNYRFGKTMYHIRIENSNGIAEGRYDLKMDGKQLSDAIIHLRDDGKLHELVLTMK